MDSSWLRRTRGPTKSHQEALNHTANICRLAAAAIEEVGHQTIVVSMTPTTLAALKLRLNGLWSEYGDECVLWSALLIRSQAVDAQSNHYDETKKSYEETASRLQNLMAENGVCVPAYTKIRTLFAQITQICAQNMNLRSKFFQLRDCVGEMELLLPKEKLENYLFTSYIEQMLDETSLAVWKRRGSESYGSLMLFIENRCSTIFRPICPPICKLCPTERHWPFKCSIFRLLAIPTRLDFVRRNELCGNCFSGDHASSDCGRPPCPLCRTLDGISLRHNSALCPNNVNF